MDSIFKGELTENQLNELFTSDERCYEFLSGLKWEKGFVCRKCGNHNYCEGRTPYSRRCTKCKSEESATAGTIFHNCKFPVHKAFYIAYNVCKGNEDFSSYEYARKLSLRQMTCWNFRKKIREAIKQIESLPENERITVEKILRQN
jgi:hypothetical protein